MIRIPHQSQHDHHINHGIHDSPSPLARVSVPTTLPPSLVTGTHRKAASLCAQCSSLQSGGRLLAGTAPGPEVQRNRDTAGCGGNREAGGCSSRVTGGCSSRDKGGKAGGQDREGQAAVCEWQRRCMEGSSSSHQPNTILTNYLNNRSNENNNNCHHTHSKSPKYVTVYYRYS